MFDLGCAVSWMSAYNITSTCNCKNLPAAVNLSQNIYIRCNGPRELCYVFALLAGRNIIE